MAGEGEGQAGTRGHRVYLIREALGTRRDPLPLPKFAELIERASGIVYDKSTISRMETGDRKVSLEDIEAIAPVDPLKRGKAWLAGWDDEGEQGARPTIGIDPTTDPSAYDRPAKQQPRRIPTTRVEPAQTESPKRRKPGKLAAFG